MQQLVQYIPIEMVEVGILVILPIVAIYVAYRYTSGAYND